MSLAADQQFQNEIRRIRIRPVALPVEHGGWGFLLEPVVIALVLAPSVSGFLLAGSAICLFLTRHPLKLAIGDRRKQRRLPRTTYAERFAIVYLSFAIFFFVAALATTQHRFFVPLIIAAPLALLQLVFDARGRGRELVPELAGSIAIASSSAAIILAGGSPKPLAFSIWLILAARNAPTVLYVRAQLRLSRHKPASVWLPIAAHVIAVVVVMTLVWTGVAPYLVTFAVVLLLVRACLLLNPQNVLTPRKLGILEVGFGILTSIAVIIGYSFQW